MTVGRLLREIDSNELTEWSVFEREYGQLGSEYDRSVLREIHFELRSLQHLTAAFKTDRGKANPVKEPVHLPKSTDYTEPDDEEEGDE